MKEDQMQSVETPTSMRMLTQLELIAEDTEKSKFALKAIAQLFIYSAIGSLIAGIFFFIGWLNIQSYNSGVGNAFISLGAVAGLLFYVWAVVEAFVSFRKSK